MILIDLLKDHNITYNKAEIKSICPKCREIVAKITNINLSIVKFFIEEDKRIKKLQNIAPNHVNLTCKCGNKKFLDKTIFRWIELLKLIIVQTDLNKDPKKHENTRMLNSDSNIYNPNRISEMTEKLKSIYNEKIKEFNQSKTKRLNSVITPAEIQIEEFKYLPIGEIKLLNNNHFIANFQDEYFNECLNQGLRS